MKTWILWCSANRTARNSIAAIEGPFQATQFGLGLGRGLGQRKGQVVVSAHFEAFLPSRSGAASG